MSIETENFASPCVVKFDGEILPENGRDSLQKSFQKFLTLSKKKKAKAIRLQKRRERLLYLHPNFVDDLRAKFVERAKTYLGTPYAKRYWSPADAEYNSDLFLDCCGLVRRVQSDLRDMFGFVLGPWNQAYMYDTLPIVVSDVKNMRSGDLVFMSGIYVNKATAQKHDIVHVEIWCGEGLKTIGSRWNRGKVDIFDSYRFEPRSFHSPVYHFRSIDTWLQGICRSFCSEHAWKKVSVDYSKKSIFSPNSRELQNEEESTGEIPDETFTPENNNDETNELNLGEKNENDREPKFNPQENMNPQLVTGILCSNCIIPNSSFSRDISTECSTAYKIMEDIYDVNFSRLPWSATENTSSYNVNNISEKIVLNLNSQCFDGHVYISRNTVDIDHIKELSINFDDSTECMERFKDRFSAEISAPRMGVYNQNWNSLLESSSLSRNANKSDQNGLLPRKRTVIIERGGDLLLKNENENSDVRISSHDVTPYDIEERTFNMFKYLPNKQTGINLLNILTSIQALRLRNERKLLTEMSACSHVGAVSLTTMQNFVIFLLTFTWIAADDRDRFCTVFSNFCDIFYNGTGSYSHYASVISAISKILYENRVPRHSESSRFIREQILHHIQETMKFVRLYNGLKGSSKCDILEPISRNVLAAKETEMVKKCSDGDHETTVSFSKGSGSHGDGHSDADGGGSDPERGRGVSKQSNRHGGGDDVPRPKKSRTAITRLPAMQKPLFYVGGANGSSIVIDILEKMGWQRTLDKYQTRYKLKWVECRKNINYTTFVEGEQMVNRIPNGHLLTNKLGLLKSLRLYEALLSKVGGHNAMLMSEFFPETFNLSDKTDRETFFSVYKEQETWIYKPGSLNQGKGIQLIRTKDEITRLLEEKDLKYQAITKKHPYLFSSPSHLIQRYITNPLLLDGRKFDVRAYMLLASTRPYLLLFREGYVRLSCHKYRCDDPDLITHLTNQYIQKKDPLYPEMKDETVWSMEKLNDYINTNVANEKQLEADWVYKTLMKRMEKITSHIFQAVQNKLQAKVGYFDIFGLDFMIDSDMKVWLIEVNVNPAFHTNCSVLKEVVPAVISETIYLSVECFEKVRQHQPLLPLKSLVNFRLLRCKAPLTLNPRNDRRAQSVTNCLVKPTPYTIKFFQPTSSVVKESTFSQNMRLPKPQSSMHQVARVISPTPPSLMPYCPSSLSIKFNLTHALNCPTRKPHNRKDRGS